MSKVDQNRLALAALTACLVRALSERDFGLRERFGRHLERAYKELRDMDPQHTGAMEALKWTEEFLREL